MSNTENSGASQASQPHFCSDTCSSASGTHGNIESHAYPQEDGTHFVDVRLIPGQKLTEPEWAAFRSEVALISRRGGHLVGMDWGYIEEQEEKRTDGSAAADGSGGAPTQGIEEKQDTEATERKGQSAVSWLGLIRQFFSSYEK